MRPTGQFRTLRPRQLHNAAQGVLTGIPAERFDTGANLEGVLSGFAAFFRGSPLAYGLAYQIARADQIVKTILLSIFTH
jgi:hypothetical protein